VDILIRVLTPEDEPFLWVAIYHAIHVPSGEALPPPEIVEQPELARYVAGWMQRLDDFGFLAEDDRGPIGAAWLRRWPGEERGYGFVDEATPELSMSVLPGYRGGGVGTRLLRRLLAAAAKRFGAVSLSVSKSNPALRLYVREGFVPVSEPKDGSIAMVKRFAP
jgi:GNAT superfamily N-acetyltransferase